MCTVAIGDVFKHTTPRSYTLTNSPIYYILPYVCDCCSEACRQPGRLSHYNHRWALHTFSPPITEMLCFRAVDINCISQEHPRTLIFCFHPWPASLLLLNYSDPQPGTSFWGAVDIYSASWIRHTVLTLLTLKCRLLPGIRGHVGCQHLKNLPICLAYQHKVLTLFVLFSLLTLFSLHYRH